MRPHFERRIGSILLGIYLILQGLFALITSFHFPESGLLMALLALAAGIAILLGR